MPQLPFPIHPIFMPCSHKSWSSRLARAARSHLGAQARPLVLCPPAGVRERAMRPSSLTSALAAPPPLVPTHAGLHLTSRPCCRRSPCGIAASLPLGHKILLTLQGPAARGSRGAAERMWRHHTVKCQPLAGPQSACVSCVPVSVTPISVPGSAEEGRRSSPSSLGAVCGRRGAQQGHPLLQFSRLPCFS